MDIKLKAGEKLALPGMLRSIKLKAAIGIIQIENMRDIDDQYQEVYELEQGEFFKFTKVYPGVFLTSETDQTINVKTAFGDVVDSSLVGTVDSKELASSEIVPLADVACANTALTQIGAVNSARRELHIHNPAGGGSLRIGDSTATAAKGVELLPGQTFILATGAVVYARNDSGASITVSLLEVNH